MANLQQSSEEIWKSVAGYEGHYEVSNTGKVKNSKTGRVLRPGFRRYESVNLSLNGKGVTYMIHRLVAQAFLPVVYGKGCTNHKDGNRRNNHASNLAWCNHQENNTHAHAIGLFKNKQNWGKHNQKLTDEQVRYLKDNKWSTTIAAAAKEYGVNRNTIRRIWRGTGWKWLETES